MLRRGSRASMRRCGARCAELACWDASWTNCLLMATRAIRGAVTRALHHLTDLAVLEHGQRRGDYVLMEKRFGDGMRRFPRARGI